MSNAATAQPGCGITHPAAACPGDRCCTGPLPKFTDCILKNPFNNAVFITEMPKCIVPLRNSLNLWPYYEVSHLSNVRDGCSSPSLLFHFFSSPLKKVRSQLLFKKDLENPVKTTNKTINRRPRGEFSTEVTFLRTLKGNEHGPDGCSRIFLERYVILLVKLPGKPLACTVPITAGGGLHRLTTARGASAFSRGNRAPQPAELARRKSRLDETAQNFSRALADALRNIRSLSAEHFWFKSASVFWAFPAETSKPQVLLSGYSGDITRWNDLTVAELNGYPSPQDPAACITLSPS